MYEAYMTEMVSQHDCYGHVVGYYSGKCWPRKSVPCNILDNAQCPPLISADTYVPVKIKQKKNNSQVLEKLSWIGTICSGKWTGDISGSWPFFEIWSLAIFLNRCCLALWVLPGQCSSAQDSSICSIVVLQDLLWWVDSFYCVLYEVQVHVNIGNCRLQFLLVSDVPWRWSGANMPLRWCFHGPYCSRWLLLVCDDSQPRRKLIAWGEIGRFLQWALSRSWVAPKDTPLVSLVAPTVQIPG